MTIYFAELKDQVWETAENLRVQNDYPFEVMPILFALSKATKCNQSEAFRLIQEGRFIYAIYKQSEKNDGNSPKYSPPRSKSPDSNKDGRFKPKVLVISSNEGSCDSSTASPSSMPSSSMPSRVSQPPNIYSQAPQHQQQAHQQPVQNQQNQNQNHNNNNINGESSILI